uniref:Uncharacterized protein n=1 Tax=Panagrolaimus superbus TaxID=310955 RepID=A0A914YPP1_9BILA
MYNHASVSSVKIPIDIPLLTEDNEKITEGVKRITKDFEDWKDEKEISIKPTPPPVIKQAWGEPAPTTATNEERRRHSRNDEPPPPLPPHRISTSRHSDSFEHDIIPSVSGHQHPTLPQHFPENFAVFEHDQSALSIQKNDESILDWCQRVAAGYLHVKSESLEESELNVSVTRKIVTNFEKSVAEIKDFKEEFQKLLKEFKKLEIFVSMLKKKLNLLKKIVKMNKNM